MTYFEGALCFAEGTNFCTVSETLRISPIRTHVGPIRHFVRHKIVHPETHSTHSVALSVEEKVAQLRRRIKFHWKDKSFTEKIKIFVEKIKFALKR